MPHSGDPLEIMVIGKMAKCPATLSIVSPRAQMCTLAGVQVCSGIQGAHAPLVVCLRGVQRLNVRLGGQMPPHECVSHNCVRELLATPMHYTLCGRPFCL